MRTFLEHEVPDTTVREYVNSVEEFYGPSVDGKDRLQLRLDEIDKLSQFKVFMPLARHLVPEGARMWQNVSE